MFDFGNPVFKAAFGGGLLAILIGWLTIQAVVYIINGHRFQREARAMAEEQRRRQMMQQQPTMMGSRPAESPAPPPNA